MPEEENGGGGVNHMVVADLAQLVIDVMRACGGLLPFINHD